jgi:hypothetical protein
MLDCILRLCRRRRFSSSSRLTFSTSLLIQSLFAHKLATLAYPRPTRQQIHDLAQNSAIGNTNIKPVDSAAPNNTPARIPSGARARMQQLGNYILFSLSLWYGWRRAGKAHCAAPGRMQMTPHEWERSLLVFQIRLRARKKVCLLVLLLFSIFAV